MSTASRSDTCLDPHWPAVLKRLSGVLDLDASARASGALVRRRNVSDGATLLRLALAHGPGGLSLRSAALWAGASGVAELSDVALLSRLHAAYNPGTSCFTDLKLTGPEDGEDFAKFSFSQGDVVVGDRGYAKPYDLQRVLTAGANFVVRVGWNSMGLITPDGERINLAAI